MAILLYSLALFPAFSSMQGHPLVWSHKLSEDILLYDWNVAWWSVSSFSWWMASCKASQENARPEKRGVLLEKSRKTPRLGGSFNNINCGVTVWKVACLWSDRKKKKTKKQRHYKFPRCTGVSNSFSSLNDIHKMLLSWPRNWTFDFVSGIPLR